MAKKDTAIDFKWKGNHVYDKVVKAAKDGVDEIMNRCVTEAFGDVPYASGTLQGSIKPHEQANDLFGDNNGDLYGIWGSHDVVYALAIETGEFGYLESVKAETAGEWKPTTRNKGVRGSLRRAADKHYKDLAGEIRNQYQSPI